MNLDAGHRLWAHVADDPFFVAGRWSGTALDLALALGVDEETAILIGLCRAPATGEDPLGWARTVADALGLDAEAARTLAGLLSYG